MKYNTGDEAMKKVEEKDWCFGVVGNIVKTHMSEDGSLLYGTPAFRGGARVYIDGKNWTDAFDSISVIGFSRGNRYQVAEVPIALIENVRCCRILAPAVLEIIHHVEVLDGWTWWGRTAADKRETEAFAARWTSTMAEETRKVRKDVENDGKMQTTL